MSSIPPPSQGQPETEEPAPTKPTKASSTAAKRPRYLIVALIGALLFGAGCWTEGCGRLAYFRGERDNTALHDAINNAADRARATELDVRFVDAADAARGRAIPIAAATFVLGAALLALAARGLAGKSNTRSALIQVLAAQAIVVGASYFVTKEMTNAETDWQYEMAMIRQRERSPPEEYQQLAPSFRAMRRWAPPGWLVFRTLASALIIVALTRPRSRAFFEAAARPVSDP